ncbi:MAG: helicase-exonuclease AddAB subunit AddA [Clostridia bacterium]|nr:helicase-exonuclease AddAB subunit AddA [Clostridia bacterium]
MDFSPEQKRVISARHKNLLVSAAAGSGKTTVLVERVLSLIREGVHIDEILIVTFTRAASQDMRAKLYKRLSELAQTDENMYGEMERLEYSSISTLHSFCTRVIRANFELADVDPEFRILEEAENALLEDEALADTLEDAYRRMDEGMQVLCRGRSPEDVRDMVSALYRFLSARPDARSWYEEALALMGLDGQIWTDVLARQAVETAGEAAALTECALALACRTDGPSGAEAALNSDLEYIRSLKDLSYEQLRGALSAFSPMKASYRGPDADPEIAEQVRNLREKAKNLLREKAPAFVSLPVQEAMEDIREDIPAFRALGDMAFGMQERLSKVKRERGALTFNDLEHLTIRVLEDKSAREKLRRKYKYVFVDEYQDTSDIQEAIVSRVAGENNRFCVGDVKQSIYRFRNAEPALFMEACSRSAQDENSELIVLGRNYRSRGAVIDFVNLIFRRVMNGGTSEIVYDDAAQLYQGRNPEGPDAPVELLLVDKSGVPEDTEEENESDEDGVSPEDLADAEKEAVLIARRIHQLMDEDRSLRYRDICVITRVRKDVLAPMAAVMAASDIPVYADGSDSVFDALEVMVTVSALRLLLSRRCEIELLCVLRSPMFGLKSEDLARIRVASPGVSLWRAVENARNEFPQADRFLRLNEAWRELAANLRLDQLIRRILNDTDFYLFTGALPGGRRRQANLDMLCQQALGYERTRGSSLSGFLEYMESMRSSTDGSGAHELGENDDVVRLMTAHKSKGLEFRVVFASMLGRSLSRSGREESIFTDKQLGLACLHTDMELVSQRPTLAMKAIRAQDKQKDLAEELRVLYVTLTRAQDRLILTGCTSNAENARTSWRAAQSYPDLYSSALDIVCAAAFCSPGAEALGGQADLARPRVNVKLFPAASLYAPSQAKGGEMIRALENILAAQSSDPALKEAFRWTYPESAVPCAPVKLSVTGLEKEFTGGQELPRVAEAPAFLTGEDKNVYTDRGTAIHAALRHLDLAPFKALSSREDACLEAAGQLNRMAERQLLSAEERACVKPAYLADFALSPLGRRAAASNEVHREWSFSLFVPTRRLVKDFPEEGRILVQGTIDLCFLEDGQWVLADYKTERSNDDDALLARYSTQLGAYAEALERITGRPVKQIYIVLARENRAVEFVRG